MVVSTKIHINEGFALALEGRPRSILVTGANGRLGSAVVKRLRAAGFLVHDRTRAELDIADAEGVQETVAELRPDVIVNAAAYTDVARAPLDPEALRRANVEGPAVLAACAARFGARLVHFSTDYVFSGGGLKSHRESDPRHPAGAYGRSKALGEARIECSGARYWIVRIGWLHGAGNDFVVRVLDQALAGKRIVMRRNQWGRPTSYDAAARLSVALCGHAEVTGRMCGVFHFGQSGACVSRFGWAQFVLRRAAEIAPEQAEIFLEAARGMQGVRLFDPERPENCRLALRDLEARLGIRANAFCPSWRDDVSASVAARLGALSRGSFEST